MSISDFFHSEHSILVFSGIVSAWYAFSWIYKILKSPKPYQKKQYFYIALALLVIILGISTFFSKFTLNCLCGVYVGVSVFIKLYHEYHEYKAESRLGDAFYILLYGLLWGLSFIMVSMFLLLNLYLD